MTNTLDSCVVRDRCLGIRRGRFRGSPPPCQFFMNSLVYIVCRRDIELLQLKSNWDDCQHRDERGPLPPFPRSKRIGPRGRRPAVDRYHSFRC